MSKLRETPLIDVHEKGAAEVGAFSGWRTAIVYSSTRREHLATRSRAGLFDVSHMRRTLVYGKGAAEFLSRLLTLDARRMRVGRMKYCLMLNERGGIIDDLTITRLSDFEYLLTTNAATDERVDSWISSNIFGDTDFSDVTEGSLLLAIQGPASREVVERLFGIDLSGMRWFSTSSGRYKDSDFLISRSGYTGEDGFEIYLRFKRLETAVSLWRELTVMGAEPCGLAARDVLRLECGYPLSTVDFDEDTTPAEARLEWAVDEGNPDFIGREQYLESRGGAASRLLVGLLMGERGIPRRGMAVFSDSSSRGYVTSGGLSFSLNRGIALGYLDRELCSDNNEVLIDIRGVRRRAFVRLGPFINMRLPK